MSDYVNWLNQNQGVLAALGLGITLLGGLVAWLLKRDKSISVHKNSRYIQAGHGVSAGGDIIVGGSKTNVVNEKKPAVTIKMDSFTHTQGRLDLIFENTGDSTAVINNLKIAGDKVQVDEFSLAPQQKVTKYTNITGLKVLEEKVDPSEIKLTYKDFSTGKKYLTVGIITQESRDDGQYNLGTIKDLGFRAIQNNSNIAQLSNLEKRVLERLYKTYKDTGQKIKWRATDAFKELNIKDGKDVSTLHDSKYVTIALDRTHECFVITAEGIRFMDNQND